MHTKMEQFPSQEYNILRCTAPSRLPTACVSAGGGGSPDITADTVCAADFLCRLSFASAEVHLLPQGQHPVHSLYSFSIFYSVSQQVSLLGCFHNLPPLFYAVFLFPFPLFSFTFLFLSLLHLHLSLSPSLCSPPPSVLLPLFYSSSFFSPPPTV